MIRLPYPGLRPFRRDESDLFFGREGSVDAMVDKLAAARFLAVLGASGSGKSSLVRTGLLDALELGLSPAMGAAWKIADFRPGDKPIRSLANGLLSANGSVDPLQLELLSDFLGRGPRSLITWCQDGNLPAGFNLLLLVDQFEELFRFDEYAGREEAEAFVSLLLESSAELQGRIYVAITMRSEFLGACSLIPGLAERINEGLYLTARMTREQCKEAIEGPAAVTGFTVEPTLVNRLLNDLSNFAPWEDAPGISQLQRISRRADQLPLMQHVLNRLWLRASDSGQSICLTLQAYEEIGGLSGALDEHGAEIMKRLGQHLDSIEAIFRALITGDSLASAVRRPTPFGELVARCRGDEGTARRIIDEFRSEHCNFLQPPHSTPLEPTTIVDITHESLIRQWKLLAEWFVSEAQASEQWARLSQAARRHSTGEGDVLQGLDLANASAWWQEEQPTLEWSRRYGGQFRENEAFLTLSQAQANKLNAHKKQLTVAFLSLLLIAIGAIIFNLYQSKISNAELSRRNEDLVKAKELVDNQKEELETKNKALLAARATVDEQNATLSATGAKMDEQNKALLATGAKLDEQNKRLNAQNENLKLANSRLSLYAEILAIADDLKTRNFSSNPTLSTDSSGVAMGGADPVSYHSPQGPVWGKAPHYSLWQGAIWLFESIDNKRLFDQSPEKFMPAYGGFCTPCLAQKHKFHGDPRNWHVHNDRLYLASSNELIENFKKNPQETISVAEDYWKSASRSPASPNVQTTVGELLKPHILMLDTPGAYVYLQASVNSYVDGKQWQHAVLEQQKLIEHLTKSPKTNPRRSELPDAYLSLAWYQLHAKDFAGALRSSDEGLKIEPKSVVLQTNRAHALLFLNRLGDAEKVYREHRGKVTQGKNTWEVGIQRDLDALEKQGITHPDFSRIRAIMREN